MSVTFSICASGWSRLQRLGVEHVEPGMADVAAAQRRRSAPSSSTSAPRAVLTRITPGFMRAMRSRVDEAAGLVVQREVAARRRRTRASRSSSSTSGTPRVRRAACGSRRSPPCRCRCAMRATSRPMPPSPITPSVLP